MSALYTRADMATAHRLVSNLYEAVVEARVDDRGSLLRTQLRQSNMLGHFEDLARALGYRLVKAEEMEAAE